jgi:hypothetical protein
MIGEFGSVEHGGSKADWLTEALASHLPNRYARIRAAVYFDWVFDGADWRIGSSEGARQAWKAAIGSSYYAGNEFAAIMGKVAIPQAEMYARSVLGYENVAKPMFPRPALP